jgi:hypothetical protein
MSGPNHQEVICVLPGEDMKHNSPCGQRKNNMPNQPQKTNKKNLSVNSEAEHGHKFELACVS